MTWLRSSNNWGDPSVTGDSLHKGPMTQSFDFVVVVIELKKLLILTHWGRVTHICVSKLTIIGSDNGFVAWPAPSHYLNQCWIIVNWTLRNKLQWNLNRNSNIFIQENAFESVVCETAAILSRPQCVKLNKLLNRRHKSSCEAAVMCYAERQQTMVYEQSTWIEFKCSI